MEPKLTQNRLKLTRIRTQLILQSLKRIGDHKFSSFIWKLVKDFYQASYLVENLMEPKLTQTRLKLTTIHPQLILQSLKRIGDHKFSSLIWKLAKDFYQASHLVENLMEPKLTQNRLKLTRIHPQLILQSLKRFGDQKFSSFI